MKAVNLLPSDQRSSAKVAVSSAAKAPAPSGDGFAAYAVLGALGLAVVGVVLMALTNNTISDRKAELVRTETQVQAAAAQVAALKPYADFKQLADARVQTVHALATTRFDWERTLHDLSHALPRDVRLSGFTGAVSSGGGTPGAPAASPTIDISGCTSSQTSVAKLMARLRAVRGVTRVALKSSAKATAAAPVAADATGGSLCKDGKGGTPNFSLTVYFERFGVPAYSAPAGAVGAAPGGPTGTTAPATPGTAPTPAPGTTGTTPASSSTTPTTEGVTP